MLYLFVFYVRKKSSEARPLIVPLRVFFNVASNQSWWIWCIRSQPLCIEFPGLCQAGVIALEMSSHWTVKNTVKSPSSVLHKQQQPPPPRPNTVTPSLADRQIVYQAFSFSLHFFFCPRWALAIYVKSIELADVSELRVPYVPPVCFVTRYVCDKQHTLSREKSPTTQLCMAVLLNKLLNMYTTLQQ